MGCNHEWVDMKNGTRDKICLKCGKRAMQSAASLKVGNKSKLDDININVNINKHDFYIDYILKGISKELNRGYKKV